MNPSGLTPCLPLIDGDTLLVDNSGLEPHQTCPRAAQYTLCHRLRSTGERSALKFGGIAHKVLETRYRTAAAFLEQTPAIESVMIAQARAEFNKWTPPEDDYRNYDRIVALIRAYGEKYSMEPFDIVTFPDGRPFVEVPFALPLGTLDLNAIVWVQPIIRDIDGSLVKDGLPIQRLVSTIKIVWQGKIDLVYRYNGGLYILDHKTASMATNMAEFEISHQFRGYEWAVETLLGEAVTGTVINRMVCRKPTPKGEPFTFERKLVVTQPAMIAEWKTDILHIVADFVEMVRREYMPKHTVWCVGKFGTCQFHRVCCNPDPEQRQFLLQSGEFEENTWSPLKEE